MGLSLKQMRLIKGKTQDEMAELLNIHVQTYRKLEENPDEATIKQAKKISEFLGVSYDDIFLLNNSTKSRIKTANAALAVGR